MQIGVTSEDCERQGIFENVYRTSVAKPTPASQPPPASLHKEHDHQAEQGVRHDERVVQRDVSIEKTHETVAIHAKDPAGTDHRPALCALAEEHGRPEERGRATS